MITAVFTSGFDHTEVSGLWQWDYGQKLRIQGLNLPPAVEIHFSSQKSGGDSESRVGVTKDGVTDVPIPDSMLENGGTVQNYYIYAFIYLTDKDSGKTVKWIQLHVNSRPKPEAFDSPEEAELFREAIAAVNESADRTETAEKSSEAWAHGHDDYPERDEDNAKFYSDKAEESAGISQENKEETDKLVQSIAGIEGKVAQDLLEVEAYKNQAVSSASYAAISEQKAEEYKSAAEEAQTRAETASMQAEEYSNEANSSKVEAELFKSEAKKNAKQTADDKSSVESMKEEIQKYKGVKVSSEEPEGDAVEIWINPETKEEYQFPEINDNGESEVDTWSSNKISSEIGYVKEDLTDVENALTLVKSRNYWNPNEATFVTIWDTPLLQSQIIKVNEGEKYYLSLHRNNKNALANDPFWGFYEYDSSGNKTMRTSCGNYPYVVPSGVVAVQFLNPSTDYEYIMIEKNEQTLVWEEYFDQYYECVDTEAREKNSAISESIEDKTLFIVPSAFYGVVGHETNIYYQNIAKNMSIDSVCGFDTTGLSNVERYRDRLIWKPTASNTSNGKISFFKNDWNHETNSITVPFKSAPIDTGSSEIKVIVIGDSKIAYGEVVRYLDGLFANDNHTLTLLGSRYDNQSTGDTRYKHEGRNGWSSYRYAYVNSYNGATNAFYNENYTDSQYGTKFDFTTYMNNQGYTSVDYVFINLGTNDYGQGMSDIKWQTDAMIKSIRAFDANIKIVIGLNEGVYRNDLQHKALNEWIYDLNATKISKYDGKASKVYVLPLYPSIDLVNDYSTTSADMSEGDSVVGNNKKRNKVSDPIHQNRAGFYKYAMCMYSLIKCIEGGLVS